MIGLIQTWQFVQIFYSRLHRLADILVLKATDITNFSDLL